MLNAEFKERSFGLGIMSGTSLDGVDIAHCSFWNEEANFKFEIHAYTTYEFDPRLKEQLEQASNLNAKDFLDLEKSYSEFMLECVRRFEGQFNPDYSFIGIHGQTIFHQPASGFTYQMLDPTILAEALGKKVVFNFRQPDIDLGGQGAPLVPIADHLLFSQYHGCINLGGFANISFLNERNERIAFDLCPCNRILNRFASELGQAYDEAGAIARKGNKIDALLNELRSIPYYVVSGPKSLGEEYIMKFEEPILSKYQHFSVEDRLNTYVWHIAGCIKEHLVSNHSYLFTGGGAYNSYLMDCVKTEVDATIVVPEPILINMKEALSFSFLAYLRLSNQTNILSTVTGASRDHIAGSVYG